MPLKRKESLRQGLQRISEKRLQDILQMMGDEGPTAESVHEARKVVKNLRAVLRLVRGALGTEARKARNDVLRNFAHRFSNSRDVAVTLGTLERIYPLSLKGEHHPKGKPQWATQLQQSLAMRADAVVPARSYRDAMEQMDRLRGRLLPFERRGCQTGASLHGDKWESTVAEGLRKTYRRGRRLVGQVAGATESDELWHELRKRVKDLGYQLALLKKIKSVKPQLAKLDKVGSLLGDARDLNLLRDSLGKVPDKYELSGAEYESYRRLVSQVHQLRDQLHRHALEVGRSVYHRGSKRFTRRLAKRWCKWKAGG